MSTVILSRRQALATLVSAAAFAAPARAGLIVGANGPLIGRAPGPVVSLERPQPVPRLPEPTEEAPAPVAAVLLEPPTLPLRHRLDDLSVEELELLKETTDSLIEHMERLKERKNLSAR